MAITLGGVSLPDVVQSNEAGQWAAEAIVEYGLDGTPIVWEQARKAQALDLLGGEDFAWISRTDLLALQALARVPGATYTLAYEGVNHLVRFRNEEQPVIDAEPILARPNQASADWYRNLTIRLMEIA